MESSRIWVLLYSRSGDNRQVVALAESLGRPFETKTLRYNWLRRFGLRLGPTFATLDRPSRKALQQPWPDLVISIGRWSVPVVRAIKARSGGRTKIVFLGNPRVDPSCFDLVFATRDYLEPHGSNVIRLPLPMASQSDGDSAAQAFIDLPHPRTLLLIGGSIKYWELTADKVGETIRTLAERANAIGGSLLVSGSPRTPDSLLLAAETALVLARHGWMAPSRTGGLAAMIAACDEVVVSGDSMSMVTEAVLSGKPVGLLPLDLNRKGMRKLGPAAAEIGSGSRRRDMRRFWGDLWDSGLAGSAENPKAASITSSVAIAAPLVAGLIGVSQVPTVIEDPVPDASAVGTVVQAVAVAWAGMIALGNEVQRDAGALWLAIWEPQAPWYVKLIAGITSAFAMSPVDLTPDVVPIVGHMDDLLLLSLGTLVAAGLVRKSFIARLSHGASPLEAASERRGALAVFAIWSAAAAWTLFRATGWF